MAELKVDAVEAMQSLQSDESLRKTFRALMKLTGGSVWEVAKISRQSPRDVQKNLERLEELELVDRSSFELEATPASGYYHLSKLAYRYSAELREIPYR